MAYMAGAVEVRPTDVHTNLFIFRGDKLLFASTKGIIDLHISPLWDGLAQSQGCQLGIPQTGVTGDP
jgi:hypothetical protein